jgi:hypothetical protein
MAHYLSTIFQAASEHFRAVRGRDPAATAPRIHFRTPARRAARSRESSTVTLNSFPGPSQGEPAPPRMLKSVQHDDAMYRFG